jgi:succinyl-diaminopimelate desuccinylase
MKALRLTEALIACRSVTPDDGGCQALIAERLRPLGFVCETLESGPADFRVTNLWAKRTGRVVAGQAAPLLVFAGHTDVVPTGPAGGSGAATLLCLHTAKASCMAAAPAT